MYNSETIHPTMSYVFLIMTAISKYEKIHLEFWHEVVTHEFWSKKLKAFLSRYVPV